MDEPFRDLINALGNARSILDLAVAEFGHESVYDWLCLSRLPFCVGICLWKHWRTFEVMRSANRKMEVKTTKENTVTLV